MSWAVKCRPFNLYSGPPLIRPLFWKGKSDLELLDGCSLERVYQMHFYILFSRELTIIRYFSHAGLT